MKKQVIIFCIEKQNGTVKPGHSAVYEPKTNFIGGQIKWFDDRKLFRNNK